MILFKILASAGLFLSAAGPVLTLLGLIDPDTNRWAMLVGMLLWFTGAIPWLGGKELSPIDAEVEV